MKDQPSPMMLTVLLTEHDSAMMGSMFSESVFTMSDIFYYFLNMADISPTTPRRNAKTQITKMNPVAIVLQEPMLAK